MLYSTCISLVLRVFSSLSHVVFSLFKTIAHSPFSQNNKKLKKAYTTTHLFLSSPSPFSHFSLTCFSLLIYSIINLLIKLQNKTKQNRTRTFLGSIPINSIPFSGPRVSHTPRTENISPCFLLSVFSIFTLDNRTNAAVLKKVTLPLHKTNNLAEKRKESSHLRHGW